MNRTPRLEVLLETLEALEALETLELKTYNVFWVALGQYFTDNLMIK
jgi:hypothetical protein